VSCSEAPPASALVVTGRDQHADTIEEGGRIDGGDAAAGTDAELSLGLEHGDEEEANTNREWVPPGLKDLEVSFDRNFVDSLCRQAGADFFLYGAPHRAATTPA